jgi:glucosyl-dolichyl phosphate glucuronosyltransferase
MDLSVVICTWNNSRRLAVTLEAVSHCVIPDGLAWEVVLVNNNSTDGTAAAARAFADRLPLVYVEEPRQGLSRAKNAGLGAASGRLVVFADDDVTPCAGWLEAYWGAYRRRPEGFHFGGPLTCEREADTLDAELLRLASPTLDGLDYGPDERLLGDLEYFVGGNWACPAEALRRAGPFDVRLGLDASLGRRRSGEDNDLLYRLRRLGVAPWYLPQARAVHFMPREKCSLQYLVAEAAASGEYSAVIGRPGFFLRRRPALRRWCRREGPMLGGIPVRLSLKVAALGGEWLLARVRSRSGYEERLSLHCCIGVMRGYRILHGAGTSPSTAQEAH